MRANLALARDQAVKERENVLESTFTMVETEGIDTILFFYGSHVKSCKTQYLEVIFNEQSIGSLIRGKLYCYRCVS